MKPRSMISFDWAMKRLLRNKANFEVLEGFLSELLRRKIMIKSIGESEGNKSEKNDKTNCVDILVEADDHEVVLIELQYDSVDEYFHRMLYGVSKSITEYMQAGFPYADVRKVYSVHIVYFDLGAGDDYIYHGTTHFTGLHTQTRLELSEKQKQLYHKTTIGDIYPEYYIIKITGFNNVAKDTLDQWIYYLKNNRIEDHFTAQGLDRAKELLLFDNLSRDEKESYLREADAKVMRDAEIRTALTDGEIKGEEKGRAEGREEGRAEGRVEGLAEGEAIGFEKGEAERARLKSELQEKEKKEAEMAARIAELERLLSGNQE